jgi:hypothetical protein
VAVNPFESPPRRSFFLKLFIPGIPIILAGAITVGHVGSNPDLWPRGPATESGAVPEKGSARFYQALGYEWAHVPEICFGRVDSEFQKGRCEDTWLHLAKETGVGLLPIGAFLAFALFALDSLALTYRRIRKRIGKSQYLIKATVTKPARARADLYSWFYCFHCISVELQDGSQLRVYLSPHENVPFPGDTVAVFSLGRVLGRKRYIATLYAPHVAVFAAVRSA